MTITRPIYKGDYLSERSLALDCLRGVAIILVIIWHVLPQPFGIKTSTLSYFNAISWSGVDLFFVLSGFLIGGILIDNKLANNFFFVFYARRFTRIIPLYMIVLILFALQSIIMSRSFPEISLYLLFLQNFYVAWSGDFGSPLLSVTWSLAVEEQFYLIAPLLVRFISRERLPIALISCIVLAPIARLVVWQVFPYENAWLMAYVLLPCRMDALGLGFLCAWAIRDPKWRIIIYSLPLNTLSVVGATIVLLMTYIWINTVMNYYFSLFAFSTLAITFACIITNVSNKKIYSNIFVRFTSCCGIWAYSLYLFHSPIILLMHKIIPLKEYPELLRCLLYISILIPILAALSWASWKFIETPFIRIGHKIRYSGAGYERAILSPVP